MKNVQSINYDKNNNQLHMIKLQPIIQPITYDKSIINQIWYKVQPITYGKSTTNYLW